MTEPGVLQECRRVMDAEGACLMPRVVDRAVALEWAARAVANVDTRTLVPV